MEQLEEKILTGESVSTADTSLGQGRGTKTEKDEEKEEEEAAEDPCDQQLEFQQSQLVIMEAHQFQFIGRLLGFPVACRDSYAQCTLCRFVEISQVQLSNRLLTCPFFQRHVPMAIQTLQFLDKDADVPVLCTTGACGGPDSAVLGQGCVRAQCCARQERCLRFSSSPELEDVEKYA